MNFKQCLFLMLVLCMLELTIHPELLIIKKNTEGIFMPLDKAESLFYGPMISQILLKYEWPMCIASDLTEDEQNELLTAGAPWAEELFIQKKLKEAIHDLDLSVIFFPTALYELFCLCEFFKIEKKYINREDHPFRKENSFEKSVISSIYNRYKICENINNKFDIDLNGVLDQPSIALVYEKMYAVYAKMNNLFFDTKETSFFEMNLKGNTNFEIFSKDDESSSIYINNALVFSLFNTFPILQKSRTAFEISQIIKEKYQEISFTFIENLPLITKNVLEYTCLKSKSLLMAKMINSLKNESNNHIVRKVILLEYEAREINKALILRGTTFQKFQIGLGKNPKKQILAGTTILQPQDSQRDPFVPMNFEKKYKEKEHKPYSISFGNSLFAGFVFDGEACAYCYLIGERLDYKSERPLKSTGYGLLINKKDYMQSRNNRLFFIPPLAPLAALFSYGEFFHARTTAATYIKDEKNFSLQGLVGGIRDPYGVILITRDPLKHAALFSNFLAENGRFIQSGDENFFTEEEKEFIHVIQKAQAEVGQFYHDVTSLKSALDKKVENFRKRKTINSLA